MITPSMPINLSKKFRGNVAIFICKSIFSLLVTVIIFYYFFNASLYHSNLPRREFGTGNYEQNSYLVYQEKDGDNMFCNKRY